MHVYARCLIRRCSARRRRRGDRARDGGQPARHPGVRGARAAPGRAGAGAGRSRSSSRARRDVRGERRARSAAGGHLCVRSRLLLWLGLESRWLAGWLAVFGWRLMCTTLPWRDLFLFGMLLHLSVELIRGVVCAQGRLPRHRPAGGQAAGHLGCGRHKAAAGRGSAAAGAAGGAAQEGRGAAARRPAQCCAPCLAEPCLY